MVVIFLKIIFFKELERLLSFFQIFLKKYTKKNNVKSMCVKSKVFDIT